MTETMTSACQYRISAKAVITDHEGKILLLQEPNGIWEFPGWWLEHGESIYDCLQRELAEEMGAQIVSVATTPCCFFTALGEYYQCACAYLFFHVVVADLDMLYRSDECQAMQFFDQKALQSIDAYDTVSHFSLLYFASKSWKK